MKYHVACYLQSFLFQSRGNKNISTVEWIHFTFQTVPRTSYGLLLFFPHNDYFPRQYHLAPRISFSLPFPTWSIKILIILVLTYKRSRDAVTSKEGGQASCLEPQVPKIQLMLPSSKQHLSLYLHVWTLLFMFVALFCQAVTLSPVSTFCLTLLVY